MTYSTSREQTHKCTRWTTTRQAETGKLCKPPRTPPPIKNRHDNKKTKKNIVDRSEFLSEAPGLVFIQPVNDLITDAVDYCNYRLLNKSEQYDDDLASELDKMKNKIAVLMKVVPSIEKIQNQ